MPNRHRVLGMLSLLSVITYLDRACISVAGPRMQGELGIGPEAWGWVVGVFAIAYGAFEIPSGLMGDRYGPRRMLTRIVVWWSAFTCLTGTVSSYSSLLIVRFCFGAGEAGAYPNASASISRWFPVAERGRAFGILWMASQAGAALTPLLIIPIQMFYGWRASFFLFGIIGMVWAAVWFWWYRDPPAEKPSEPRPATPWRAMMHSANLWTVMLVALAYCYASYFFIAWFHTFLVKGRGFSEQELTLSALPFALGAAANGLGGFTSDLLVGKLGLTWGRRAVGLAGLSLSTTCMAAAAFTTHHLATIVLLSLCYAGIAFQQPVVWAVCLDIGKRHAGAVSGAMNTAAQLGSFLLSVSFGYLVSLTGSYDRPLLLISAVLAAGTFLWLRIDPARAIIPSRTPSGG
jgi:MFS transporter, ACS family, glucarate transporter